MRLASLAGDTDPSTILADNRNSPTTHALMA